MGCRYRLRCIAAEIEQQEVMLKIIQDEQQYAVGLLMISKVKQQVCRWFDVHR
jgi:hypothetical protein